MQEGLHAYLPWQYPDMDNGPTLTGDSTANDLPTAGAVHCYEWLYDQAYIRDWNWTEYVSLESFQFMMPSQEDVLCQISRT